MQLTGALEETRKRWEAVPALASMSPLGGPRPGASVLAVTSGPGGAPRALVAVQRYGAGRSMVFTGEASWRWRMMLPANDRSYDTFWRQSVRWLALTASDPVSADRARGRDARRRRPLARGGARRRLRAAARRDGRRSRHLAGRPGRDRCRPLRTTRSRADGVVRRASAAARGGRLSRDRRGPGSRSNHQLRRRCRCWSAAPTPR